MLLNNLIDINRFSHFSFDLWLTIIKSHPEYKYHRCLLIKDFFSISETPEVVEEVVRSCDILCNRISEKTGYHIPVENIVLMILDDLNIDINGIDDKIIQGFYQESENLLMKYKPTLLYDGISDLLYSIKMNGKTMNISSNTAFIKGSSLRKILEFYDLERYFSFQIYSDELGYSKPSTIFFEKVFDQTRRLYSNIEKGQIVHIGDNSLADYKGASEYGFQAILMQ